MSYVVVTLDNMKYRSGLRANLRVPYYRENFVFEVFTSAAEIKRKCLWFTVVEPYGGIPRMLGEAGVDLAHVWRQPHHTITHKWVQLTLPTDPKNNPVGYLKVDISISVRAEMLNAPFFQEKIEDNVLILYGSEQQPACYQVTIFRAYNVPCNHLSRPDITGNPPNTCVRLAFCDMMGQTSPQHRTNNPVFIERVSLVEMFPNVCDTIQFDVCSVSIGFKVLASTSLKLSEISHGGENGFLPTFGPSLLHMYGPWRESENGPFHRGALLVALRTIVPYYRQGLRTVLVEPVLAGALDAEWVIENFVMFCPVFEVSMLHKCLAGTTCGVAITTGELPFGGYDNEQKKLHYTGGRPVRWTSQSGHLEMACPVLQLAARLPDLRLRVYVHNVLLGLTEQLENSLSEISARLEMKDYTNPSDLLDSLNRSSEEAMAKIKKFLEIVQYSSSHEEMQKYTTELDRNLVQLQKEKIVSSVKIEKIYCRLMARKSKFRPHCQSRGPDNVEPKKAIKIMLAESKCILQELKQLMYKTPDGWPHISVWLLSNGSRVAHAKIPPSDIIHSITPEQSGQRCGKIQTESNTSHVFHADKMSQHQPPDCHCIYGKVELLAWMGLFRYRAMFQYCIPDGYRSTESGLSLECDPMPIECRVNIYRAKLCGVSDISGLSPFVRIHFMNNVKETQVCQNTAFPIWSEMLRISCSANVSILRLKTSPPEILVELYHWDATQKDKIDLLGRVTMKPVFVPGQDLEAPSTLDWHNLRLGAEDVGRIQMSAQIMHVTSALNQTWVNRSQEQLQRSSEQIINQTVLNTDVPEPLPLHILPANTNYKMDVYFWGLREVSITNKPLVTLELEDVTVKSAIITHSKSNCNFPHARISQTFQGNLTNGSQMNIKLFDTTTFGRTLFVGSNTKKPQKYLLTWLPKHEREEKLYLKPVVNSLFTQACTGLVNKDPAKDIAVHIHIHDIHDFDIYGTRCGGEKSSGDKEMTTNLITIYDSELEEQPEFGRFKDWCSTIKIYNCSKTGIPDKDEKLRCGYLKASIAIYQWPSPEDTVAVSSSGVDLERGYFDSYPDNEPARYLVRIYAVKCSGMAAKGFNTSRCYVAVQCNSKKLSDRESSVQRETEPIFGKMYELDCTLPDDYLLKISVLDCGTMADELIGSTSIDLEDRAYTKYRADVGLASEYNINGPNRWRDSDRPSAILEQLCEKNHLPPPEFPDPSSLILNGVEYKDLDSGTRTKYTNPLASKENLCLNILHKWHTIPVCGHRLVPEHVEVRTLYDPDKPGIEQGKLHMWVDMFPLDSRRSIPSPVSIRPHPDEYFELRVVVWDVQGLKVAKGANIYVRAWIGPSDEAQDTDVYTTTNGEGRFSWRMVFQFQYKHTERKLVLHDKGPFTEVTELFPPILVVQVLDIDAPSLQDFIGMVTLDLSGMPRGSRLPHHANVTNSRKVNMFSVRNSRGWWPLRMVDRNSGNYYFAGMIELEISLLPQEKALLMPVGLGRDPPAPLPDPNHEAQGSRSKLQSSLVYFGPTTRFLVALGFILLGLCLYWQLPVIVVSVLPSSDT
ncbi:otoferlin-like [Leguminivora glycinivorella]|uniref:otoferlin-like n=1 Tax=Leguminivora glycinivorella TaxID=1035111 RepID=UPI00200BDC67|nr:otoferlin-like [Leguminivora glycinivorella]